MPNPLMRGCPFSSSQPRKRVCLDPGKRLVLTPVQSPSGRKSRPLRLTSSDTGWLGAKAAFNVWQEYRVKRLFLPVACQYARLYKCSLRSQIGLANSSRCSSDEIQAPQTGR